MSEKEFISVYKSSKRQEMYVYMKRKDDISNLPEALMAAFGEPKHVLDLVLTRNKKLARVDAGQVLDEINDKGFFLQMPPSSDEIISGRTQAPKDSLHG